MKYKKFAKIATSLINQDHDDLELLSWTNENLVNEHGMIHIWDAQMSMRTTENCWGDSEDIEYDVVWDMIFPNLQKVLDHFNIQLTKKEENHLGKLIKTMSYAIHGYYGDANFYEIKIIDSYDLFKFCKLMGNQDRLISKDQTGLSDIQC